MILLDGKKLSEFNIIPGVGHVNPSTPSFSENTIEIPGMDGLYYIDVQNGVKKFRFPLATNEVDRIQSQRILRAFINFFHDSKGQKRLVEMSFDYEADKFYYVRMSADIQPNREYAFWEFDLEVTAHDPWAYSATDNTDVLWGSEIITFQADYLLSHTFVDNKHITSAQTVQATVNGYTVRPTFLISGSGNDVTFSTNGKSFSLSNFSNSEWVLDGEKYTVVLNGANGYAEKTSGWIELIPGLNDIQISGTNMNFTLSVKYKDKYM